jgi:hypothetical protein
LVGLDLGRTAQRQAHGLPGQKLTLARPGLFGSFLGRVGGGDLRVDLARIGSPEEPLTIRQPWEPAFRAARITATIATAAQNTVVMIMNHRTSGSIR